MKLRECMLLLPGYGLDDFPRTLPSNQAHELLGGWVALWHPNLINACRTAPRWQQATYPPLELNDLLMVLPSISQSVLRDGFAEEVAAAGGMLVPARAPWADFQAELLRATELTQTNATIDGLKQDFAALGYAYLQVQLMTRQLRYTSNLDELLFSDQALQAAQAALADDRATAERMLQSCFDQLGQERDHYYSLDVNLIDVTLLAPTTLGASLKKQLSDPAAPTSLLASAAIVGQLHLQPSESIELLTKSLHDRQCTLVGGLEHERPHPLMSFDAVRRDLIRARAAYASCGVAPPKVFSRYSYGATPDMPLHLRRTGFTGAMLIAWENGSYPQGAQAKISWEASDGTFLPALTPKVMDASDPSSFLVLGLKAGEALDREQVPAMVLAHWPSRYCDYFHLLVTITKRTPALGKWVLADDFFENSDPCYHQERLAANQFRHDWLSDSSALTTVQIFQRTQHYQRLHTLANSSQNLANLVYQLEHYHNLAKLTEDNSLSTEAQTPTYQAAELAVWAPQLSEIWNRIDALLDPTTAESEPARIDEALAAHTDELLERLARRLVPGAKPLLATSADKAVAGNTGANKTRANEVARLIINPYSCATRLPVHIDSKQTVAPESACVHSNGLVGLKQVTLTDTPQFGFVLAQVTDSQPAKAKQRALADTIGLLQNEFLEAQIDLQRGHLRSFHAPGQRGNRFSFSLARRELAGNEYKYSEMQAERVQTLVNTNVQGAIRASGRMLERGEQAGKFEVDYTLWRGSRVLDITVRLSELKPLSQDPWKSAYVLRFAWPTDAAIVRNFAGGTRDSWSGGTAVAPQLIEVDEAAYRTHLLTGGLAFHRRIESRFMETLIAIQGQSEVTQRFGIAVDLPYPQQAAAQFVEREYEVALSSENAIQSRSSWLFNVDAKNTRLDMECPLTNVAGRLIGQRVRLTETEGKLANTKIRCSRDAWEAYRVDNLGGRLGKLTIAEDSCTISLRANERVLVDILWKL